MEMAEDTREGSSTEDSRLGLARKAVFAAARGSTLRTRRRELEALRIVENRCKARRRRRQKAGAEECICGNKWGGNLRQQLRY